MSHLPPARITSFLVKIASRCNLACDYCYMYEHADQTYDLADEKGIVLWTEIPLINNITESPGFYANSKQQLIELVHQRFNHPSVVCWGIYNEVMLRKGPETTNLVCQLAQLAAQLDSTRPSTCAINGADIDHYLMKPCDPPEERLYAIVDDMLDDWQSGYRPDFQGVRVIGNQWSPTQASTQ